MARTYKEPVSSNPVKSYIRRSGDGRTIGIELDDGSEFYFSNSLVYPSAIPVSLIEPAATFTNATPTDGGSNTIVLTSDGAHGFTSAVAVGYPIYISGGAGWTPGFYPITAVPVDTTGTAFSINGTFDAGMGIPTIALANTQVTLDKVVIPPLFPGSLIRVSSSFSSPNTSGTAKIYRVNLGSTSFFGISLTSVPNNGRTTIIQNRGSTDSQIGVVVASSATGEGSSSVAAPIGNEDTSVATDLTFTAQPAAANIPVLLERYLVEVFL